METSSIWLCDLACRLYTKSPLPDLVMILIHSNIKSGRQLHRRKPKHADEYEEAYIVKGARKKKWAKHIVTKCRIRRAFRYR